MKNRDMKKSALQFRNPKIEQISFKVNNNFIEKEKVNIDMSSQINIQKNNEAREAVIKMMLHLTEEGNAPFHMEIVASSDFRWKEDINFDIDNSLKVSGATMLLSYRRPIVANITMQSGLEAFHIPFIDFSELQ